jgi:LysM repeat protein
VQSLSGSASRRPRRSQAFHLSFSPVWLAAFACVGTVLALGLWLRAGHLLPGTFVAGTPLGGASLSGAEATLAQSWASRPIRLEAGDEHWTATAAEMGLVLDAPASVRAAWDAGRSLGSVWNTLVRRRPLEVAPVWLLDGATAGSYFAALADKVAVAPTSAGIAVQAGQVTTTPTVDGRLLDQAATLVALQGGAEQAVATGRLALVTRPVPAALRDVSQAKAAAEALLARSLSVQAWDPVKNEAFKLEVPSQQWGPWLRLAALSPDGAVPTWTVDGAALDAWWQATAAAQIGGGRFAKPEELAQHVARMLNGGPADARLRLYHGSSPHVVESGETVATIAAKHGMPYPWIQQANPDVGDDLRVGQEIVIPSPDLMLPLPIVEHKRIKVSLAEQRLTAFENDQVKWEWPVSTGIDSSPTSPGVFQVQSHDEEAYASNWDLNMPKFMGIYRPIPTAGFMNGFHGFPTRGRTGSQILWTGSLGHRVTFGCILLGTEASEELYRWAESGTLVEITP